MEDDGGAPKADLDYCNLRLLSKDPARGISRGYPSVYMMCVRKEDAKARVRIVGMLRSL